MSFRSFKAIETNKRVRMREVKIYRNGAWVYCDAFAQEERETHEAWAREFLEAMKLNDTPQNLEQPKQKKEPEAMPMQVVQQLIWDTLLELREACLVTNREAADICLVRFTWTEEQAKAKLTELEERHLAKK